MITFPLSPIAPADMRFMNLMLILWLASTNALASPRVLASINPLHSLAAAVMQGAGEPGLLLAGAASPHDYALKPSDLRKIADADLVLRIGNSLEPQLNRALRDTAAQRRLLDADQIPGMNLRPLRATHAPEPGADAQHAGIDPHLWLDPTNAGRIAAALTERLSELDPQHAALYRNNLRGLNSQLEQMDKAIAARLEKTQAHSYAAFHDGYQYFEARYGIRLAAAIAPDPALPLSLKRLRSLKAELQNSDARCLILEPQHPARLAHVVAEDSGLRLVSLDPLGAAVPPGPKAYFSLMEKMAESFADCLGAP